MLWEPGVQFGSDIKANNRLRFSDNSIPVFIINSVTQQQWINGRNSQAVIYKKLL